MEFPHPLVRGLLLRRYKRFLADVEVEGEVLTVHCPNPGAMLGLSEPGATVWLSKAKSASRSLGFTLELVEVDDMTGGRALVGVNTGTPNALLAEALRSGAIPELSGYDRIRREVRYGLNSRIDFLLEGQDRPPCYVEAKNVHLCRRRGLAEFPDCVTARGAKHMRELADVAKGGARAVLLFCIQRTDCTRFALAADLDPAYAEAFDAAVALGVETLAYACHISTGRIEIAAPIPFCREHELHSDDVQTSSALTP